MMMMIATLMNCENDKFGGCVGLIFNPSTVVNRAFSEFPKKNATVLKNAHA
jgi:hypothetical protein